MSRCQACSGKFRIVPGDGPIPCPVMLIGERPGRDENREGIPFCGMAGVELNETYLPLAGLRRSDVYVTNSVKCWAEGNRKPTPKETASCAAHHLPNELEACRPDLILLLGSVACSLMPDVDLETEHGFPREGELFGWKGIIVPMYHPASGLHDTGMMIPMLEDWERLGQMLRGRWEMPTDQCPIRDYRLIQSAEELDRYVAGAGRYVAIDTERHGERPFSLQFSCRPGSARMILSENRDLLRRFGSWVKDRTTVFHNGPQDQDTLDAMGLSVHMDRDTMQEAYHLGNLPQGLKALAYRLFGVRMKAWRDVVMPYSREKVVEWLWAGVEAVDGKAEWKLWARGLKRILRHTAISETYDPWGKIHELAEKLGGADRLAEIVGPVPEPGIGHVPIEEAVAYACGDADMTLRVFHRLAEIRNGAHNSEWSVTDDDRD